MSHSILWDCHMHSSFSSDSETPMEQMAAEAVRLGLQGICFTEHLDPEFPDTPDHFDFSVDFEAYRACFLELQSKYSGQIKLRYGVEFGMQPHLAPVLQQTVLREPFDFVIGSVHLLDGMDPYYPEAFLGKQEADCYRRYFETVLACLKICSDIDTLGHLDYILRYGPTKNREFRYADYQELLDEILEYLIRSQIALEVNTGGYHAGLGAPNPSPAILCRYRELGGTLLTIGADAHTPDRIAESFDRTADLLRECGFRFYTVFKSRVPEFLPL